MEVKPLQKDKPLEVVKSLPLGKKPDYKSRKFISNKLNQLFDRVPYYFRNIQVNMGASLYYAQSDPETVRLLTLRTKMGNFIYARARSIESIANRLGIILSTNESHLVQLANRTVGVITPNNMRPRQEIVLRYRIQDRLCDLHRAVDELVRVFGELINTERALLNRGVRFSPRDFGPILARAIAALNRAAQYRQN